MQLPFNSILSHNGILGESGLYKIINKRNGHWYVGSTKMGLAKRFNRHRKALRNGNHANQHLQNAYNKYGSNSFVFLIVKHSPKYSFVKEEQRIIDINIGKPYFYNVSNDASAPMTGRKHSPETIVKLRAAAQKRSKEIGENTRLCRLGTKHSDKTIRRMRRAAKRRDDSKRIAVLQSPEFRKKISDLMTGRLWTPEHRKKQLLVMQSDKYRKMMSKATIGIPKSSSMKNKSSITRLGKQIVLVNKENKKEMLVSIRTFCKKHKMNRHQISALIHGKREEYLGWSVANNF